MKINHLILLILLPLVISACKPKDPPQHVTTPPIIAPEEKTGGSLVNRDCELTLGFDAWEPYQYVDVGGRIAGLDIELVEAVTEGIGCQLVYQQGTWVDLLMALKKGDVDILLGASKVIVRQSHLAYSKSPW